MSMRRTIGTVTSGAARLVCAALLVLACTLAGPGSAWASKATVRGTEMAGYGRVVLSFDDLPRATVRVSSGILILGFDKAVSFGPEKLALDMPGYISAVRMDPDGRGIRIALARPARPNLMEAGEKLFIDLLPESWRGLPPSLPTEVIEELSRRAKEAEERVRQLARRKASEEPRDMPFRVGTTPTFSRLVFEMPVTAPVDVKRGENRIELTFDTALRVDAARLRAALPGMITGADAEEGPSSLRIAFGVAPGVDVRPFREDDTFVLDFAPPKPKTAKPGARPVREPSPEAGGQRGHDAADGSVASPAPGMPTPITAVTASPAGMPVAAPVPEPPAEPSGRISVAAERGSVRLGLGLPPRTPLAVFERGGSLWVAAETPATFDPSQIGVVAPGTIGEAELRRVGRLMILRVALLRPLLVRAAATEKEWVVSLGDEVAGASTPLQLARGIDKDGRTIVTGGFPDVAGVHWVEDPDVGDRLAIVTGRNAARGLVKAQAFVDFRAIATAQGLAIVPQSDDVAVRSGIDDVVITRDGGLSVSLVAEPRSQRRGEGPKLVIDRESWERNRSGNVRDRGRALMRAAAEAPKSGRGDARLAMARFEIAAGLSMEALGTLGVLASDDPDLGAERGVQLLAGIAQALAGRLPEAAKVLAADALKDETEAVLWRAFTDAQLRRWQPALVGFRRAASVLQTYPEDLQGKFLPLYAEAAIEGRDFGLAQKVLETLEALDGEHVDKPTAALLAARVAEGQGRLEEAFSAFDKLAKSSPRPTEARAKLHGIALALKDRSIDRAAAIAGLETLSVSWRGDDVEARTLGLLGRLYAEEERWRDAFSTARRANQLFPDNPHTRSLYDETGSRFETLFLDGKAETIPRLDAISLYFDFKEFTPPGRRGDEMIRRLAERLVELDLLQEAGDLLTHQVDNRLNGAAKASVATRLAVIHLMNRQPAKAYQTLRESRLSEMPQELRRARLLLEVRALSDLSRTDLALEMIAPETGSDVERLRADILWQSRRWREAGEVFERMVGTRWQSAEPLDDRARADVTRAAIAYGLADEALSLERLRAKFATKMSDSVDARPFAIVTAPGPTQGNEYRELAKAVASADTLSEFLSEYRRRYPDTPAMPTRVRRPDAAARPDSTRVDSSKGADGKPGDAKPADGKPAAAAPGAADPGNKA